VFFVSPYFDHDAFMHHTMHALDAPAWGWRFWTQYGRGWEASAVVSV